MGNRTDEHLGRMQRAAEDLRAISQSLQQSRAFGQTREQPPVQLETVINDIETYTRWAGRNSTSIDQAFQEREQQTSGAAGAGRTQVAR